MEIVPAVLTGIQILMNIGSCRSKFFNYNQILDENMLSLTRKMEVLRSREEDINTELSNAKCLGGKTQKREVETWLKNVQDKRSEVQQIEQKVGKRRYFSRLRFLRLIEKCIQEVDGLIEQGRFPEGLLINVHQDLEGELMTTPLVGASMKERNFKKIWDRLMNDGITRIGVYGMGGVGKTSLITHIHNQLLKSTGAFNHVYWVTVSQDSSIHKLQANIAEIIKLNLSDEKEERRRAAMICEELRERRKFVLILDDMWEDFPLDAVGIPIATNAGKLVVTSRSRDVCRRMYCQEEIQVEPLPVQEAWDLFVEKLGCQTVLSPEIETIAKLVAKECCGLPLAIIVVAGSMRGVHDIQEWRNALVELREQPTQRLNIDMETKVFRLLKFSYDRLSDEKLQQCLLYCALFPEDYHIKRADLIVCWIAVGLVEEMKTRQAEFDRGHALLNKLVNVCLLEAPKDDDGNVKMHDVIRDMALNITKVNPQFMVKAGVQLREFPGEREWSESLERVSLMNNEIEIIQPSSISPKCPRLRTLMLQNNTAIKEIPNSLFVYMPNLRVLDLSNMIEVVRLPDSISNLKKLRALLLHCCKKLRYVPSLAKLTELRELDLMYTSVEELPDGIEKLVNLKRLDLCHINSTTCVLPSGVLLNLSRLQRVIFLLFVITDEVQVEEIIRLRQLEVVDFYFSNLGPFNWYVKSQHWQSLSRYHIRVGGQCYDQSGRRRVAIISCNLIRIEEDPLVLPTNIQDLAIRSCHDLRSLLDISSYLRNVMELECCRIDDCQGIQYLWSWSEGCSSKTNSSPLQSLTTLQLWELQSLEVLFKFKGVGVGGAPPTCGSFSNLEVLEIGICNNLKYVFTRGLVQHHLQSLEFIHVWNCSKMETIIKEEEEEEEEIVAEEEEVRGSDEREQHYDDNNSIITCPKLQRLVLRALPKLKSIWKGTMLCHSLQLIQVQRCRSLKKLPLSQQHLNDDDSQISPTLPNLKNIYGEQDWWDLLEWDHPHTKSIFQPLFAPTTAYGGRI